MARLSTVELACGGTKETITLNVQIRHKGWTVAVETTCATKPTNVTAEEETVLAPGKSLTSESTWLIENEMEEDMAFKDV